ncbi:helix-turn-helix domain-containing protein [Streptomyces sp. NPDC045431]|uniref:helix-turn-helix domain-containing protein n=1 Tax=Streptomyces sp. NPDC045431 TaxID=3155613 RepID=UPI0033CF2F64
MTQSTTTRSAPPLPPPKERRRLREARSLSESQVAEVLGVTKATVRSWETGRSSPRGRKREAYVKLLRAHEAATAGAKPANKSAKSAAKGQTRPRTSQQAPRAERRRPQSTTAPDASRAQRPEPEPEAEEAEEAEEAKEARASQEPQEPETAKEASEAAAAPQSAEKSGHVALDAADASATSATSESEEAEETEEACETSEAPATASDAFDALYACAAPAVLQQAYLLTGRRRLAREAVEYAFHLAWERWPEVAVDPDPAGWVRAAAHAYALSPWHRLRPTHRQPDPPTTDRAARALRGAVLDLPPPYRRALLLYDGLGMDLPETAAELEASTPAAAHRILGAREAVAERLPELADPDALHERLAELLAKGPTMVLALPRAVRTGSERRARTWTRAAIGLTTLIVGATAFTLATAPTAYEPPLAPGEAIAGVPVLSGPQRLTPEDEELRDALRGLPFAGPPRLLPDPR